MIIKLIKAVSIVLRLGPDKILQLEGEAKADPLTGLLNRRGLDERLTEELERFKRHNRPFLLAFIDLDELKMVNDLYGHQRGDQVIVALSETIKRNCRTVDFAARVGGDEFIVIFTETSDERVIKRLRKETNNVSIGSAIYNGTQSLEEVIRKAEEMMRQEKRQKNSREV